MMMFKVVAVFNKQTGNFTTCQLTEKEETELKRLTISVAERVGLVVK
jgi:hypothetical protein